MRHPELRWFVVIRGTGRVVAWPDTEEEAEVIVRVLEKRHVVADVLPPVTERER